uniref:RING-type domain-containing protein n=1 Tax=Panagrellus redivivus TaxID=6233 RepID=A0A7E4UYP6_PANRE
MADAAILRETLTAIFPDLDIDAVLLDFPGVPLDNLANILYEIPPYMNTYRKVEQLAAPPPAVVEEPEPVAAPEPPPVDLTDELCNELVRRLREDLETDKMPPLNAFEHLLKDAFPTLKPEFVTHCLEYAGNRRVAAFIVAFLAFNNLSDRLNSVVPNKHELFKHLELGEAADPPPAVMDKFIKADYQNVNEVIDVLKTYDAIVDLEILVLTHQFTCGICRERYSDNVAISCDQGANSNADAAGDAAITHKYCPECIKVHTDLNAEEMPLLEGGAGLKCIEHECQRPIYISKIRSLLKKHVINRLDERIQAESLAALGIHIERCDACDYAVELEKPCETNKVFACPQCNKAKCRICKADWDDDHFGVKCHELVEMQKREKNDKYMKGVYARMNEVVSRKCHKCNLQFVKSDGCNKMVCRCGSTQCYLCRAENVDYNHFCRHVYDSVLRRCTQCTKCSLYADATAADNVIVEKIAEEAAKVTIE